MSLGLRLWSYVREEASHGRVTSAVPMHDFVKTRMDPKTVLTGGDLLLCLQKAPIDPFTKERCKPSASQGVPLGGMGCVLMPLLIWTSYIGAFWRTLPWYQHIGFAGAVAFLEVSGESSRIGTSYLVCVRVRRSWRTSSLYASILSCCCLLLDFGLLYDICVQCFLYSWILMCMKICPFEYHRCSKLIKQTRFKFHSQMGYHIWIVCEHCIFWERGKNIFLC